jgi:DNA polymerase-3 subunit gamma/tau
VGQDAVVRSLRNALTSGRLPHAFMFSGIRGVGKTTLARLLAMCLNCQTGVTDSPCMQCPSCQEIIAGNHPDVTELDAASRTQVDKMRELLGGVHYAPATAQFKIYIMDEIHMLSTSSFNALLKTLEEPPRHVKFIFATTEVHKVLPTILSRCQRYNLQRVTRDDLVRHFAHILTEEKIDFEPSALELIAGVADGSVRDGLSLLDQAVSYGSGHVGLDAMRQLLGLTSQMTIVTLLEHLLRREVTEVLTISQSLYREGMDPKLLVNDLLGLVYRLSLLLVVPDATSVPDPDLHARLSVLAQEQSFEHLQMVYQCLMRGLGDLNVATPGQADVSVHALEMLLLRVIHLRQVPGVEQLIHQLTAATRGGPGPAVPVAAGPSTGGGTGGRSVPAGRSRAGAVPKEPEAAMGGVPVLEKAAPVVRPSLDSWPDLVQWMEQQQPVLAIKMKQHVACVGYQTAAAAAARQGVITLRLTNACFGPPRKIQDMVTAFFQQEHIADMRVVVQDAVAEEQRPETIHETVERQQEVRQQAIEQQLDHHPVVVAIKDRFNARVVAVHPRPAAVP